MRLGFSEILRRSGALTLLLLLCVTTQGAERFRHYNVKNGLSSNYITCFLQDQKGLIWIGTDDGLNKFDSQSFTIYRHDIDDPLSIGDNSILSLMEDSEGYIWIGTGDGIYRFDPATERFYPLRLPPMPNGNNAKNNIYSIVQDRNGNIWFTSFGNGVFRYNPETEALTHYFRGSLGSSSEGSSNSSYSSSNSGKSSDNALISNQTSTSEDEDKAYGATEPPLISNQTSTLIIDGKGDLYLATADAGISVYDPENDRFIPITSVEPGTNKRPIYSFAMGVDTHGDLWVGDMSAFRYLRDDKSFCTSFEFDIEHTDGRTINAIMESTPGNLLLGTSQGLTILNTTFAHYRTIKYESRSDGLSDVMVTAIMKDREGGLWIGTESGGINYLSPINDWFEHHSSVEENLPGNVVNSFAEDDENNIWIGFNGQGLLKYSPKNEEFTPIPIAGDNKNVYINTILFDEGYLWVGTYSRNLLRIDKNGNEKSFIANRGYLDMTSVYSIFKDSFGLLWIGTYTGIFNYDYDKDECRPIIDLGFDAIVYKIVEDDNHTLWFATKGRGLISLDLRTGKTIFHSDNGDVPPSVNTLVIKDETLYIGTNGYGLYTYDLRSKKFTKHPSNIFKKHTTIESAVVNYNDIWLTTNAGIVRIDSYNDNVISLTDDDALQAYPYQRNAALVSSNGQIYLGGDRGFDLFNPQVVPRGVLVPNVIFKDLKLGGSIANTKSSELLDSEIDYQRSIRIPDGYTTISVGFVSPTYVSPSQSNYRYRLLGLEKEWNYTDNRNNSATYTNLKPGDYKLEVEACGFDRVWNEESSMLSIRVLPPWWASKWMFLIYALLAILLIMLAYSLLVKRYFREQDRKLKMMADENERRAMDEKIQLFTNITHEIRTPVTLILAPVDQALKNDSIPAEVREDLEVVKKNGARLLDLVNQILDFSKAEQTIGDINLSSFDVCEVVESVVERFRPLSEQKRIELTLTKPETQIFIKSDMEAITKIVSNLLTNALKFTRSVIEVSVTPIPDKESVDISVRDNGMGIKSEEREKIFDAFYQGESVNNSSVRGFGMGLSIVRLLVQRLRGRIELSSIEGKYTNFEIILPYECGAGVNAGAVGSGGVVGSGSVTGDGVVGSGGVSGGGVMGGGGVSGGGVMGGDSVSVSADGGAKAGRAKAGWAKAGEEASASAGFGGASANDSGIETSRGSAASADSGFYGSSGADSNFSSADYSSSSAGTGIFEKEKHGLKLHEIKERTLLIVEDNQDLAAYLSKTLSLTFNIYIANNGIEALDCATNVKPDIIIADVMMPIMDGFELCKRIREDIHLSHIPIILLTAKSDTKSKIEGLESGADVYIEKPVSMSYLSAQINSLLENRNKLRTLFSEKPFMPISSIAENKADEKWLTKLNQVIEENISNGDFAIDDLARSVNMSRTLLFTKVKAVTGLTPNDFIRLVRLRRAAELLSEKEYKINEICYMVGYNSPSYFAKCFYAQFGVLPKDFNK